MTREEIIQSINSYISQSLIGMDIEDSKIDFKERWYDLSSKPGISEFLKDTSSIANTFGLDGFLIIGFNEKSKTFYNSKFSDCKLKDKSEATNLVNKNIDRLFEFEIFDIEFNGNFLSVIHIPPSIDKPHFIRNHQTFDKAGDIKAVESQRVFVRKNSGTHCASKHDIELMFYDRKNIIPEYKVYVSFFYLSVYFSYSGPVNNNIGAPSFAADMPIIIENNGRRPVSIVDINFELYIGHENQPKPKDDRMVVAFGTNYDKQKNIIALNPNTIQSFDCHFCNTDGKYRGNESRTIDVILMGNAGVTVHFTNFSLRLSNGNVIIPEVKILD